MQVPLLDAIQNVTQPAQLQALRSFYAGPAASFKIHLDDACGLPSDWRTTWDRPLQWGLTGKKNWATKYGAQGFIPHMIAQSPFVTDDWRVASASVVVLFARQYAGGPTIVQQQCLQRLRARSAAFQATNGSKHFFIFTDSRGAPGPSPRPPLLPGQGLSLAAPRGQARAASTASTRTPTSSTTT